MPSCGKGSEKNADWTEKAMSLSKRTLLLAVLAGSPQSHDQKSKYLGE